MLLDVYSLDIWLMIMGLIGNTNKNQNKFLTFERMKEK